MRRVLQSARSSRPSAATARTSAGLRAATLRLALGLGVLLLLQGCALLSPPPPREGGSTLSDAAREARKQEGDKHERLTAGETRCEPEVEVVVVEGCCPDDLEATHRVREASDPASRPRIHAGFVTGVGSVGGSDLEPYRFGGLQVGLSPSARSRVDLTLLGVPSHFTATSDLRGPFESPFEIAADFSGRVQLMPEHTAFGLYPIVGFRVGTLLWDYRNAILIDDESGTRSVEDDWINYYAPYGGIGVSLVRTRRLEVGLQFTGGVRFYDAHTEAGLRNDRFEPGEFTQATLETTVRF